MPLSSLLFSKKKRDTNPPFQVPNPCPTLVGLKALTDPKADRSSPTCVNRCVLSSPSASSLSTSSSSAGSDTSAASGGAKKDRGKEVQCQESEGVNGDDEDDDNNNGDGEAEEEEDYTACWAFYGWRDGVRRFPPAIPLLARTGNLSCQMPWVLKRTYKEDGSLVIQEVRVKHHEFFRARRAKGRLTLNLVRMDENVPTLATMPVCQGRVEQLNKVIPAKAPPDSAEEHQPPSSSSLSKEERCAEEKAKRLGNIGSEPEAAGEEARCKVRLSSSSILSSSMPELTCGMTRKGCFRNRSSGSLFQMPMPTMRPVRS